MHQKNTMPVLQSSGFSSFLPLTKAMNNDKEQIFFAILNGQATTRSEATKLLAIRSTTVSQCVADLLDMRLLTETASAHVGRGRPSLILVANPNRLVTIVFQVISQSIHAFVINLIGNIIAHEQLEASPECDNEMLTQKFRTLYQKINRKTPKTAQLAGIVFSLGGLFDRTTQHWIYTSRWPKMHNLYIKAIFPDEALPISISRTLDNELMLHLLQRNDSTLLLHWGYGVGFAFGLSIDQIVHGGHAFGEIGHWHIQGQQAPCHCGQIGCLETTTALWAIGHKILGKDFKGKDDEEDIAEILAHKKLLDNPVITQALSQIITATSNACRVFFPKRVIVSGPFVKNPQLWAEFCEQFQQQNRFFGQTVNELSISQTSRDLSILGAAIPALEQALTVMLSD